jgi:hypothetical protein
VLKTTSLGSNRRVFVIDDVRSRVFPLVLSKPMPDTTTPFPLDKTNYLGVGFFVAKNGIAVTAGHVLPDPADVPDMLPYAIIWDGKIPRAHKVTNYVSPDDGTDLAVFRIEGVKPPYLELSFRHLHMGEDVSTIGIPADSTWDGDRDYRLFKGHVMRSKRRLDLSFPALRGMSGSPVVCSTEHKVVAVISANHRSEVLEDQVSEENDDGHILKVRTVQVTNFAIAEPLERIARMSHEQMGDGAFEDLIAMVNAREE